MRLTQFTDYSLRVLMVLAARPQQRATIAELAQGLGVSRHHLGKVVHFLGQRGWATTLRGKGGGLTLGQPAGQINLGAVVRAAEGAPRPAECFEKGAPRCEIASGCRLQQVLHDAAAAFEGVLAAHTLQDLTLGPASLQRVLLRAQRAPTAP